MRCPDRRRFLCEGVGNVKSYIERAFQRLRGYCAKKTNCDNCRFVDNKGDCVLSITVPCDWKMPEESGDSKEDE